MVGLQVIVEADHPIHFVHIVTDHNRIGVHISHFPIAFGINQHTGIVSHVGFQAGTYDWHLRIEQGHSLTHHVRTHQRTVGIVVFQERNQRSRDRGNLVRRHVHQGNLFPVHNREVGQMAHLDFLVMDGTVRIQRRASLGDNLVFFFLRCQVNRLFIQQNLAVFHPVIRRFDKAQLVDNRKNAKRGNQTDVRTFRGFNRTQTAIVGVVDVSHFEAGTLAAQTSRTQGGDTALVRHFRQGVGLIHELGQLVGPEEGIDDRTQRLGIDQVGRREDLVVAHVHPFTNRAGHTVEADPELSVKLLADRTDTTIAQVVDIIHFGMGVDQLDQMLDDADDVFLGQDPGFQRDVQLQLAVDTVTSHLAQVVTLVGEKQFLDNASGRFFIWRFGITQLPVYEFHGLLGVVGRVLLQSIENNGTIQVAFVVLAVNQDRLDTGIHNHVDMLLFQFRLTINKDFGTFNRNHFSGVLVHEVFHPGANHTGSETGTDIFLQSGLAHFHFLGKVENFKDILIRFKPYRTQQRGDRQFLLTVDIRVHHIVDVGSELHPRPLERDDTGGVQLLTVGMVASPEENTGRAVELGYDNTFGSIDNERTAGRHVGNHTQIDFLDNILEVFVLAVGAEQFQFRLERNTVCQPSVQTFLYAVTRRIDKIIKKFEHEIVTCVSDWEILCKNLVKTLIHSIFRIGLQLKEVLEGFELDVQEIDVLGRFGRCKIYLFDSLC